MTIATVTGLSQTRDISEERRVGVDGIVALQPVPGSLKNVLSLAFESGKQLKVEVSEQDFEKVCALSRESQPSDEDIGAENTRAVEASKRARREFLEGNHSCPVCEGPGLVPLGGPGSYWIEHDCGAYSQLSVTLEQALRADWLVRTGVR